MAPTKCRGQHPRLWLGQRSPGHFAIQSQHVFGTACQFYRTTSRTECQLYGTASPCVLKASSTGPRLVGTESGVCWYQTLGAVASVRLLSSLALLVRCAVPAYARAMRCPVLR
eukprot:1911843-Rhodomonas_salina.1